MYPLINHASSCIGDFEGAAFGLLQVYGGDRASEATFPRRLLSTALLRPRPRRQIASTGANQHFSISGRGPIELNWHRNSTAHYANWICPPATNCQNKCLVSKSGKALLVLEAVTFRCCWWWCHLPPRTGSPAPPLLSLKPKSVFRKKEALRQSHWTVKKFELQFLFYCIFLTIGT